MAKVMRKQTRDSGFSNPTMSCRMTGSHSCHVFRILAVVVTLVWSLNAVPILYAQHSTPTEYEVKAAYLYKLGKFVEWPDKSTSSADDSFPICVLGQDPFRTTFDTTIAGENINGKKVVIKRIAKPNDAASCRIVFISSSEESRLKEILTLLSKASVLTVSDMPRFTERGGMVEFVVDSSRVRFQVNLTTAERAGLTLSSQLLKVAIRVERNYQPGG
jgi:hypothetical protein